MNTPSLAHLTSSDYERIYEPAEDSFLLIDALEADLQWLTSVETRPWLCLEVGSGSGVVVTAVAELSHAPACMAVDVDEFACRATVKTSRNRVQCVAGDLTSCFGSRLDSKVDLLLFNPPYVPTDDVDVGNAEKRRWAGGERGRRVIDRFLPRVSRLLSPGGRFYLVVLLENDPEGVCAVLATEYGLDASVCLNRRCGSERLSVIRAVKPPS